MSIRRALALSVTQRFLNFGIQLGTTIVVSRLITPAQTGIFSLAMGLVGIVQMFRDFGVGEYLVQVRELTHEALRNAFAIALTLGWGLGCVLLMIAVPAAHFYHEPVVADVVRILSLNFFMVPLGYIAHAMLTREMRFDLILIIQTASSIAGSAVSILLVWMGLGSIGLAWSLVAGVACNILLMGVFRPREMLYWPSWSGWFLIGRFGAFKVSSFLLEQIARRAPDFFLARSLGFEASGLYSRASGLAGSFNEFITTSVYRVALPSFVKVRNEGTSIREAYVQANRMLACLPLSFFSFAAVFAGPLIHLLFGDQWTGAIAPMRWLAITGMITTPVLLAGPVLTANGGVGLQARAQIIGTPIQIGIIAIASMYSIEAVAVSSSIAAVIWVVLWHRQVHRLAGVTAREMVAATMPGLSVAAAALILPTIFLFVAVAEGLSVLPICFFGGALYVVCWVVSLFLLKHPYRAEIVSVLVRFGLLKNAPAVSSL